VRPPLVARSLGQPRHSACGQHSEHPVDGLPRSLVNPGSNHDQDPPVVVIDGLATFEVALPLLDALDVVPSVIFDTTRTSGQLRS
jgi:hypothetical protein